LDPNYALAWSWLSVAYSTLGSFHSISREEACRKAKFASEHAAELAPTLADAHVNVGANYMDCDRNWVAAKTEIVKALGLDPGDARAWATLGKLDLIRGEFADATKDLERAADLDPLRPTTYAQLMLVYWVTDRLEDAETAARKVLELAPAGDGEYADLGLIMFFEGRIDEALAAIEREPEEESRLTARSIIYLKLNRHTEGDRALKELIDRHADDAVDIADVYAQVGQADHAFDWLQRAFADHPSSVNFIKADPLLLNLHGDPRFKALLGKLKLPD
jgi:tetratricopeptide (TPR) repeat protein